MSEENDVQVEDLVVSLPESDSEVEMENIMEQMEQEEQVPDPSDENWTEYILSHLTNEEKHKDNPTVDGLRRVTELVLGRIIDSISQVVQAPTPENERRATVVHAVTIEHLGTFSGSADVYAGNTFGNVYSQFPVAFAETRAEGRALRRALKLSRVIAAEEATDVEKLDEGTVEVLEPITENQINFISIQCHSNKFNIDVVKLVKLWFGERIKNINQLSHKEALEFTEVLSNYNDPANIPDSVKGYDENWKESFV